jgi:hypothetical protein
LKTYQLKNLTSQKEELPQLKSDTTPVKNSNPNNLKEQSLINNNVVVKNFKQLMKAKAKLIEKLSMSNKTRNF